LFALRDCGPAGPIVASKPRIDLDMALVKKSRIAARKPRSARSPEPPVPASASAPDTKAKAPGVTGSRRQKAVERLASASEQIAGGLTQSAAAAEELRRSMEQIAAGAEEAASASQEQASAIKSIAASVQEARSRAEASRHKTLALQTSLAESSALIRLSTQSIARNAERQGGSVAIIAELERRAGEIGEITRTVTQISDQTNLLALNAAIEAARAGDHGRGFAVVAEEVRALAGVSEKSATDVRREAEAIQAEVQQIVKSVRQAADAAKAEATSAGATVEALEAMRLDMVKLADGSEEILQRAAEADRAAQEAERSAAMAATAAEEQSSAAAESQTAVQQQSASLDQSQKAAQELASLTEKLRSRAAGAAVEQISAAANELSANVVELSSASAEINTAVEQISRAAEEQAAAAHESSAAMTQIESSATTARKSADVALDRSTVMAQAMKESRAAMEALVAGVSRAIEETRGSLDLMRRLEVAGRRIHKLVDAIGSTAIQTTMLAVSGAVEAARAGDSGRGFAVVSNDIRGLAREAATNVEKIRDTVDSVIEQMTSARRDLDQVLTSAEAEVERSKGILGPLDAMAADIGFLIEGSRVVQQGAEAILSAATQAAAGGRQIAAAAEQTSTAARQAATASEEQARGTENLAAAVEEIASLAEELKSKNG
jgi:methyl-accepting chemotaxis protein